MLRAAITLIAMIGSFVTTYALCNWASAQPGPAMLAAILAMSVSRVSKRAGLSQGVFAWLALPAAGLLAAGIGWVVHANTMLGACLYVACMFLSVWLRNFGAVGRACGRLIALPLIVLLVVPAPAHAPGGPLVDLALAMAAGLIALGWVALLSRIPLGDASEPVADVAANASPADASSPRRRPSIATRMALQLAVAVAAAFAVGLIAFPQHWAWSVLTAYIVCAGARGRGDAAYTGVLRLCGAAFGTVAALAVARIVLPSGVAEATVIFAVIYIGLLLRDVNYAYWAACITLVVALLSPAGGDPARSLLVERLVSILAGAICGVASAWFVLPIRTQDVIRRRLADALKALDDLVQGAHRPSDERLPLLRAFEFRLRELEAVATPVRWHRRIVRTPHPDHPAIWVEIAGRIAPHASNLAIVAERDEARRTALRRAIGRSRKAIADHGKPESAMPVSEALRAVHDALS